MKLRTHWMGLTPLKRKLISQKTDQKKPAGRKCGETKIWDILGHTIGQDKVYEIMWSNIHYFEFQKKEKDK